MTIDSKRIPKHVAIIMDGNGRWAKKKGFQRVRGHQKGAEAVREIVTASREAGIRWLTLYAFSQENWKRPRLEVQALMKLLKRFLKNELNEMLENEIRLKTIGRTENIPLDTRQILLDTIEKTAHNTGMTLTLALSYGSRQEIVDACIKIGRLIKNGDKAVEEIDEKLISSCLYTAEMPDPDLLIRTSGEYRISNFLLWQLSYTELYITPTLWPDFGKEEYLRALEDYQRRERRFGGVLKTGNAGKWTDNASQTVAHSPDRHSHSDLYHWFWSKVPVSCPFVRGSHRIFHRILQHNRNGRIKIHPVRKFLFDFFPFCCNIHEAGDVCADHHRAVGFSSYGLPDDA